MYEFLHGLTDDVAEEFVVGEKFSGRSYSGADAEGLDTGNGEERIPFCLWVKGFLGDIVRELFEGSSTVDSGVVESVLVDECDLE